jgi:hypothetical protein
VGVWLCGILRATVTLQLVGGWGDLCLVIRSGLGEANTARASVRGGRVGLCLVSSRPGPGEADAAQAAELGGQVGLHLVSLRPGPGEAKAM